MLPGLYSLFLSTSQLVSSVWVKRDVSVLDGFCVSFIQVSKSLTVLEIANQTVAQLKYVWETQCQALNGASQKQEEANQRQASLLLFVKKAHVFILQTSEKKSRRKMHLLWPNEVRLVPAPDRTIS